MDNKIKTCKRCGCDFPNIEIYRKGCSNCETLNEMFKRSMSDLNDKLEDKEIQKIKPHKLPFRLNDKIFRSCDCENFPNCKCKKESFNDQLQNIKNIAGVSEDLMGKYNE
jgi:hypothetical protein